jgi:hypothetical protein
MVLTPSPSDRKHAPVFVMGAADRRRSLRPWRMRGMYPAFLGGKLWLKLHTPLGRLASMSMLELEETPGQVGESVRS